jgi:hypothetical protein
MRHATKNTAGCCDGHGQVHHVATDDPSYEGALSFVLPCRDPECLARRRAAWARECGERPDLSDLRLTSVPPADGAEAAAVASPASRGGCRTTLKAPRPELTRRPA